MNSVTDIITPGALLKWVGLFFAFLAFVVGPWRRFRARSNGAAPAVAPVVANPQRTSFLGRIGNALATHTLISVIIGVLGLPFIITVLCVLCGSVIWICGGQVVLPDSVMAGPRAAWADVKAELKEIFQPAPRGEDEGEEAKKSSIAHAVEEAKKIADDTARKIQEAERKAAEDLAEKKRDLERAAECIKTMEREAAEKVRDAERKAAERVQEAKDMAAKAESLAKTASMLGSLPSIRLPGFGAKSPEQVALDRERLDHQQAESEWRSYRASQPLSRMTLQEFKSARKSGMPPEMWEEERLRKAKWRAWNAGYDFR